MSQGPDQEQVTPPPRLLKRPEVYSQPNGLLTVALTTQIDDVSPLLRDMINSSGYRVQQAMDQVVVGTVMGVRGL